MRTPEPLPDGAAERLAMLLQQARSKAEYQRIQCVWMRATLALSAAQIATALGWQASSVRHVQAGYLRQGEAALASKPKGGRHRQNLTIEQEKELLLPFLQQAEAGGVLVVAPVQAAYEQMMAVRSTTRWSTVRCIAKGGAKSCRARSIRRLMPPSRRSLKKAPGLGPGAGRTA